MSTINEARKEIYDTFITGWGSTTPVVLANEEFDEPDKDQWTRLTVKGLPTKQKTLGRVGNRKFTRQGIMFIQIFLASETGTSQGDSFSTIARDLFEGTSFTHTTFIEIDITEPGNDGKWYQYLVQATFNYEEVK